MPWRPAAGRGIGGRLRGARPGGACTRDTPRRAVTLIELLVTLTLLALLAGVVGLALRGSPALPTVDRFTAQVLAARDSALRTGHPVSVALTRGGEALFATAYPDGRVVADDALHIDPLTGRPRDATR